jgi:hypothetical protein
MWTWRKGGFVINLYPHLNAQCSFDMYITMEKGFVVLGYSLDLKIQRSYKGIYWFKLKIPKGIQWFALTS